MRILVFSQPTAWRTSSLQSPARELIRDSVMIGGGLGTVVGLTPDGEVGDGGSTSRYQVLGVPSMDAPTMLSPSSLPQTSEKK